MPAGSAWNPTRFARFVQAYDTSVGTAQIVTDVGPAFIKAMGNRGGPHHLASEWVGTHLARWFQLSTFDAALLELRERDEIPFARGGRAAPGPAFVTREEQGDTWDGEAESLALLDNPEDIARLVVFDTWVLNCDRHYPDATVRRPNYDNVFLSEEGAALGRYRLKAMDHTHCFGCRVGELGRCIADLDHVKDENVFGLFPAFSLFMTQEVVAESCHDLLTLDRDFVGKVVASIPLEWDVREEVRSLLVDQIVRRAAYLAETLEGRIRELLWP